MKSLQQRTEDLTLLEQQRIPLEELLPPTSLAILDVFVCLPAITPLVLDLVRRWQTRSGGKIVLEGITSPWHLSIRWALVMMLVFVFAWICMYSRWFRHIGWHRLWAPLFVLLILCPAAWFLSLSFRSGIDWICLLLLQFPVAALYIWCVHTKSKRTHHV